ncbi:hypothetical protein C4D60_Mb10t27300 [Musa balbisiana]|uniref:Uncharacterized protein n=1 Tax=Musa balbisiana TaxID=52838 RepID=A0A4S8J2M9_MUSBA|nr:hypothetical protein C4D60_Mb10t27300 [Musa balbisiana]
MADVWKSEVLPRIQKVFGGGGSSKKVAAAEVVKSFDESKEEISKECEEKKSELQPKPVSEAAAMYGPAYVSGPITFTFEKVKSPAFSRQTSPLPV